MHSTPIRTDETPTGTSESERPMTVTSAIDTAHERVERELERTEEKRQALDQFHREVREIEPDRQPQSGGPGGTGGPGGPGGSPGMSGGLPGSGGGTRTRTESGNGAGCKAVRRAFSDHVAAYSGDAQESHATVHEAIAAEFSEEVAMSLASADAGGWLTPQLKRAVLSETERRQAELSVMETALEREASSLASAGETQQAVVNWVVEHNPTPLSELSFDELTAWHDRLATHREALDAAADERQQHLDGTTGENGRVGIEHEVLVEYLYAEFDSTHPALAAFTQLDELCREARESLRGHLTRRV